MALTDRTIGDFRERVYERYVTAHKDPVETPGGAGFQAWCEENYLPLLARLDSNARILELGCGGGELLEFLRSAGFRNVEGVDVSPEQVGLATKKGLLVRIQDAREALREADVGLDAIIAIDFLEHFSIAEIFELLDQVITKLRRGGLLLLRTPNGGALFGGHVIYGDVSHMTIFAPSSLGQTLRLAGFNEITIRQCPPARGTIGGRLRAPLWAAIAAAASALHRIETGKKQSIWTESMVCACRKPDSIVE